MIAWICAMADHPRMRNISRIDDFGNVVNTMFINRQPCACRAVSYFSWRDAKEIRMDNGQTLIRTFEDAPRA